MPNAKNQNKIEHSKTEVWPTLPNQEYSDYKVEPVGQGLEPVYFDAGAIPTVNSPEALIAHTFKDAQKQREINLDHTEAHHANKVAKRLAKKAVRMAQKGISSRWTYLGPLGLPSTRDVDNDTGSMALNAELKNQGYPITAKVYRDYDYEGTYNHHTLEITHLNDVRADKHQGPVAR